MYRPRALRPVLLRSARDYPVVTVTGPRQSGKTTLCRQAFPRHAYANLERPDTRRYAVEDPYGFLRDHAKGAVIDEVQHAPELLSWIQAEVDERPAPGRFVLTGSEHLGVSDAVAQSLAGRTAVHHLYPLSLEEIRRFAHPPQTLLEALLRGGYPRIHAQGIRPERWLADYVQTYVERDVRRIVRVGDLEAFHRFVRLVAGRSAQELNLSTLGSDAGISHNTARSWLSVLEASFLVQRIPAWAGSVRKRLVRTPKLHWLDTGLLCFLLGIHSEAQLALHPLRGAIFETWVVGETLKAHANRGLVPRVFHLRESRGAEVDLLVETRRGWRPVECKSGATVPPDAWRGIERARTLLGKTYPLGRAVLVYGGDVRRQGTLGDVVPWHAYPALEGLWK